MVEGVEVFSCLVEEGLSVGEGVVVECVFGHPDWNAGIAEEKASGQLRFLDVGIEAERGEGD